MLPGCGTASEGLDDPGTELLPIVRYFAERNKVRGPPDHHPNLHTVSTGPALPGSNALWLWLCVAAVLLTLAVLLPDLPYPLPQQ